MLSQAFGSVTEEVALIGLGSSWQFCDTGEDLGGSSIVEGIPGFDSQNWKHPDFDDDLWGTGPAPLGYGSITGRTLATLVGFGDDTNSKYPTTYFRHSFQVRGADELDRLTLRSFRDDGVVVYLTVSYTHLTLPTKA